MTLDEWSLRKTGVTLIFWQVNLAYIFISLTRWMQLQPELNFHKQNTLEWFHSTCIFAWYMQVFFKPLQGDTLASANRHPNGTVHRVVSVHLAMSSITSNSLSSCCWFAFVDWCVQGESTPDWQAFLKRGRLHCWNSSMVTPANPKLLVQW